MQNSNLLQVNISRNNIFFGRSKKNVSGLAPIGCIELMKIRRYFELALQYHIYQRKPCLPLYKFDYHQFRHAINTHFKTTSVVVCRWHSLSSTTETMHQTCLSWNLVDATGRPDLFVPHHRPGSEDTLRFYYQSVKYI